MATSSDHDQSEPGVAAEGPSQPDEVTTSDAAAASIDPGPIALGTVIRSETGIGREQRDPGEIELKSLISSGSPQAEPTAALKSLIGSREPQDKPK